MPSTFTTGLAIEKIANGDQSNTWGTTTNSNWDKVDAGMGWQVVSIQNFSLTTSAVNFTFPAQYVRLRIEWQELVGSQMAYLYVRYSTDGTTYNSTVSGYINLIELLLSGSPATSQVSTLIDNKMSLAYANTVSSGVLNIYPKSGYMNSEAIFINTAPSMMRCASNTSALSTVGVSLFMINSGGAAVGFTGGRLRLLGALS